MRLRSIGTVYFVFQGTCIQHLLMSFGHINMINDRGEVSAIYRGTPLLAYLDHVQGPTTIIVFLKLI